MLEDNADAVIRTVSISRVRGHPVILLYTGQLDARAVEFARRLGSETIRLEKKPDDEAVLCQFLSVYARDQEFPGLLFHQSPEKYIDYERSMRIYEESSDYVVMARTDLNREAGGVLVAVPAYNEASSIESVVRRAKEHADDVMVIDDGSNDDTPERARQAGGSVVEHTTNSGYGAALQTAFEKANERGTDQLVVIDGDGQHDTSDIPVLIEELEDEDVDVVIGSRFVDGVKLDIPLYRWVGLRVINFLTNVSMGVVRPRSWIKDTQSGFRAYNKEVVESLSQKPMSDGMSASIDILYYIHNAGYAVKEVGTTIDYDVENSSNNNPVLHGLTLVNNILKTIEHERPITVLGVPGFSTALVGLGFGYLTVMNFVNTQTFPVGMALISAFATLLGILSCFTAIILHSLTMYGSQANHACD
jgi:glycosyltransferase involved in cell wall biosynthesis